MAKISILCGPAYSGKQQSLVNRFLHMAGGSTGGVLWLGPSYRAIEEVRPLLFSGGTDTKPVSAQPFGTAHSEVPSSYPKISAPLLLTFHDFAGEIIRVNDPLARPISHLHRRLLVDEIITELAAQNKLSHFKHVLDTRGFSETIFALLTELKQSEIPPNLFRQAIEQKLGILSPEETSTNKYQQCALIYEHYQTLLNRHRWYDLESRIWHARDLLQQGKNQPFEKVRGVFVYGFTNFTRTQHDILEQLAGWVEELWITLPDERDETRAELFDPVQATLSHLAKLSPEVSYNFGRARLLPSQKTTEKSGSAGASPSQPAGIVHLRNELFRPLRQVTQSSCADGIGLIEAPGMLGEARMVARHIKLLLQKNTPPDDILVVVRDIEPYADLLHEVFSEYGIPIDIEGTQPLLRNAAVSLLLRTLRIPEEDFPFAQVTALLRSTYFRPDWAEVHACPDIPQHAEVLLRLLGEPRGRNAYLASVQRWAENPPLGLEDEQAEESRRRRTHLLAKKCRAFLSLFFHSWDSSPEHAPLKEHVHWLKKLAQNLGINKEADKDPTDKISLERFWIELDRWTILAEQHHGPNHHINPNQFQRLLNVLAARAGIAHTPRGRGRVRVLGALLARGLKADHVFLMGLGEKSFPQLTLPESLFDEPQRQAFRQAGLDFPCLSNLLPQEKLLFYQIVTSARRSLTLSYPAVDERGQELLPSSFLVTLLHCFEPKTVPVERRNMLIEKYDSDVPLSLAEYRVQAAVALKAGGTRWPLPDPLSQQLSDAYDLAYQRFDSPDHGIYDGLFRDPEAIAEVARIFTPERILSPTALENYIACPFKFFLGQVLRLQPLEEPSEEIESTERGLVFHRALSRLHKNLRSSGVHAPTELVEKSLVEQLAVAVEESANRSSPAAEILWRLEGERWKRLAPRYRRHWQEFIDPWIPKKFWPQPAMFEVGFGLPPGEGDLVAEPLRIQMDGIEVRISGRIDRVDLVELSDSGEVGFWIIDYKTGRSSNYTGNDLKEFRRLQLTLYALAVEQVFLAGKKSRPMGLAYWMVAEKGPKVVLPGHARHLAWLEEKGAWERIREQLQRWVIQLVAAIREGQFALKPRSEYCTQTCDFSQICRISQSRSVAEKKSWQMPLPVV